MKQYIWMAAVVLAVEVNASENPFDPSTNISKIDQAEQQLLGDLAKIAKKKEAQEDLDLDSEDETTAAVQKESKKPATVHKVSLSPKKVVVSPAPSSPKVSIETQKEKEARLKKVKEEQERLAAKRAAAKKAAEEKAAREAAELARIKKAQEAKKAAAEKLAKEKAEKVALEKKQAEEKNVKMTENTKKSIEDINITKEAEAASEAAKKSLEDAIREVDQD